MDGGEPATAVSHVEARLVRARQLDRGQVPAAGAAPPGDSSHPQLQPVRASRGCLDERHDCPADRLWWVGPDLDEELQVGVQ